MQQYEIIVQEVRTYNHSIIIECQENQLNNLPDPKTFKDVVDYANDVQLYASTILVNVNNHPTSHALTKIINIIPIQEE